MAESGGAAERRRRQLIDKANGIPFSVIIDMPRGDRTQQIRCPFGPDRERHQNGDRSRSARYYQNTNKIFCFTEGKAWRPTDFISEKLGVSQEDAAKALLRRFSGGEEQERAREHRLNKLQAAVCNHVDEDHSAFFEALEFSLPAGDPLREQVGAARDLEQEEGVPTYAYAQNLIDSLAEFKQEVQHEQPSSETGR